MSLGWQCESALLPSKSKPINIDGKSILGLKALLYKEEQRLSDDGVKTYHRKTRKSLNTNDKVFGKTASKSIVESDELDPLKALTAKAKLYDEINNGLIQLDSDMVDFQSKKARKVNQNELKELTSADINARGNWEWYVNDTDDSVSSYKKQQMAEALLKSTIEDRYLATSNVASSNSDSDCKADSNLQSTSTAAISDAARIKTQWEKTLNSSARGYLGEVQKDLSNDRSSYLQYNSIEPDSNNSFKNKKSEHEIRMELISQKRNRLNQS